MYWDVTPLKAANVLRGGDWFPDWLTACRNRQGLGRDYVPYMVGIGMRDVVGYLGTRAPCRD